MAVNQISILLNERAMEAIADVITSIKRKILPNNAPVADAMSRIIFEKVQAATILGFVDVFRKTTRREGATFGI